jgi:hypothetical protein
MSGSSDDEVVTVSDDDEVGASVAHFNHQNQVQKKKKTLAQRIKEKMPHGEGEKFLDSLQATDTTSRKRTKLKKDKLRELMDIKGNMNDVLWMHVLPGMVEDLFDTFSEVEDNGLGVAMRKYLPNMTAATSEDGRVKINDVTLIKIMKNLKSFLALLLVNKEARKRCQEEYMKMVKMFKEYDAYLCDLHVLEWTKLSSRDANAKKKHLEKQPPKTIMPTRWLSMLVDWKSDFFKNKYQVRRDETDTGHYFYFDRKEVKSDDETIIEKYISRALDVDPFFPDMITFYNVVLFDTCSNCNVKRNGAPMWGTIKARYVPFDCSYIYISLFHTRVYAGYARIAEGRRWWRFGPSSRSMVCGTCTTTADSCKGSCVFLSA